MKRKTKNTGQGKQWRKNYYRLKKKDLATKLNAWSLIGFLFLKKPPIKDILGITR